MVIGGTLLTGGVGYVAGTLFGVLILGIIQTLITFDGTLSSWWTRIVVGALLFVFCLLQRAVRVTLIDPLALLAAAESDSRRLPARSLAATAQRR